MFSTFLPKNCIFNNSTAVPESLEERVKYSLPIKFLENKPVMCFSMTTPTQSTNHTQVIHSFGATYTCVTSKMIFMVPPHNFLLFLYQPISIRQGWISSRRRLSYFFLHTGILADTASALNTSITKLIS